MEMILISTGIIGCFYFVLIFFFMIGWSRIPTFFPKGDEINHTKISVIVACRNEEKHIRQLISCLAQQSNQNFELIIVNDHSDDATRHYILTCKTSFSKIQLVDAVGYGKKNALKEGILRSTSELIVTTDADCLPSFHWLETIVCFYQKYPSGLIICPVKLSGYDNLASKLQVLEFTSLIASSAGSAGSGMPVLCNGANLAFTKKSWLASLEDLHEEELSGDDMFLLESVKKRKGIIRYLKSESAFVTTESSHSLGEFMKQRRRWTSKVPAYSDWQIILTALTVFSMNLLVLVLFCFSVFIPNVFIVFISLFFFKYVLDSFFLQSVRNFFHLNDIWFYSFLLSVFYPFYVLIVTFSSLMFKTKTWK